MKDTTALIIRKLAGVGVVTKAWTHPSTIVGIPATETYQKGNNAEPSGWCT